LTGFAVPISLEIVPGRLRRLQHGVLLVLGGAGFWVWFGLTGAVPFALWWVACCRPRRQLVVFREDDVRLVRLSRLRIAVGLTGRRRFEIFRDELPAATFAALRRRLKAVVSAGGRFEDVEPV
jgi:hypothetical protein